VFTSLILPWLLTSKFLSYCQRIKCRSYSLGHPLWRSTLQCW
jgi:hypothetical protein